MVEQVMFEVRAAEMLAAIDAELEAARKPKLIASGHDAAWEAVKLMRRALTRLPPEDIIDADDPTANQPERWRILYEKVGKKTTGIVADGCSLLVELWESAWQAGNVGPRPRGIRELAEVQRVCRGERFLVARRVEEMETG